MLLFALVIGLLGVTSGESSAAFSSSPLPVVLWHGMGDDCCSAGMTGISKLIASHTNDTFVHSIRLGSSTAADRWNSFFMPAATQVAEACAQLKTVPELVASGMRMNVVGFSQGGQFLRALVQQCEGLHVHNLISIGGQHQGVFGLPQCPIGSWFCKEGRILADFEVYSSFFQKHLAQANYWQDALDEEKYQTRNTWLPGVNGHPFDANQKIRLTSLHKFVMLRFLNDTMVVPSISEHFGWYRQNSNATMSIPLNETALYTDEEDVLGLRDMDAKGKLVFLSTDGNHLQFSNRMFIDEIIQPFLA